MAEGQDLEVRQTPSAPATMAPTAILERVAVVQDIAHQVMKKDTHFGTIPGCDKPSLWQAGAEILGVAFHLAPRYERIEQDLGGGHRDFITTCELVSTETGLFVGSGCGSCSTMESKYRYRKGERVCPECGAAAIIKGKAEYGGGWICFSKKGGCGAKFADEDTAITKQDVGRVEYDNPADYYNTCRQISDKRAYVKAIRSTTGCSDIFTQDMAPEPDPDPESEKTARPTSAATKATPSSASTSGKDGPTGFYAAASQADLNGKEWLKEHGYDFAKMKAADWKKATEEISAPESTPQVEAEERDPETGEFNY
jgi:hypothetical protein